MASYIRISIDLKLGTSNFIVINFDSEEEINRVYHVFAKDEIQIIEPLHKPLWNGKYAEFIDKFHTYCMFNFDYL